jgi:methionyl-tRNA formyltransferase
MKRVVFLGTPDVAAKALDILARGLSAVGAELVAVVAQPPARSSRHGGETPCPVHALSLKLGVPVLTPARARDPEFLETMRTLAPDLCVTAAYGNILPQAFLDIPKHGTLNIHPSLLPQFRGAAPVQRAIESGTVESGVTICLTVLAMDAGPIVAQDRLSIGSDETAPEFLDRMFCHGAERLLAVLPRYLLGEVPLREQDTQTVTHAAKVSVDESWIDFQAGAASIHNKVRAFFGWPGTRGRFRNGADELELKIVRTRLVDASPLRIAPFSCQFHGGKLLVGCGDGSLLELAEIQAPGKRAMAARDFWNGLREKHLEVVRP